MKSVTYGLMGIVGLGFINTAQALASGMTMEHVHCASATESFSFVTHSTSAPGGPISAWSEYHYQKSNTDVVISMANLFSVSAFDQDRSIVIISSHAQAGAVGYVHVYANAFSKTVLLDINVEDSFSAPTDGSTVTAANTNGLRKVTGMTCKINGDVIQI